MFFLKAFHCSASVKLKLCGGRFGVFQLDSSRALVNHALLIQQRQFYNQTKLNSGD